MKIVFRFNLGSGAVVLALLAVSGTLLGQRRARVAQMIQVPFPFLDRTIKFHALQLGHLNFIPMGSQYATLPAGFQKLSRPQNIVQLEYGYRREGVIRIYETPKVPKISAKAFLEGVVEAGVFRDTNRQANYEFAVIPNKDLFVAIGSTDHLAFAQAVKDIALSR